MQEGIRRGRCFGSLLPALEGADYRLSHIVHATDALWYLRSEEVDLRVKILVQR